ncbi:MAG: hypothetical protein H7Y22_13415 [Gemmatimonadaceae bacterium]|nr:hypothetical protein [Gloeobacterales cyanobacterium ES-bin-141]
MFEQIFSSFQGLPLPEILVPGTAMPVDPGADIAEDDPTLVPPPWEVAGRAAIEFAQFPIDRVRSHVPLDVDILQTWPGYTFGAIAFITYDRTPVGPYNEIVIAPALVRYRKVLSLWVTSIDVDSEVSYKNGRLNWGLPKEQRSFEYNWHGGGADLTVSSQDGQLLSATCTDSPLREIALPEWMGGLATALRDLTVPLNIEGLAMLTYRKSLYHRTPTRFEGKASPVSFRMNVSAPEDSPYHLVDRRESLLALAFNPFQLNLSAPGYAD